MAAQRFRGQLQSVLGSFCGEGTDLSLDQESVMATKIKLVWLFLNRGWCSQQCSFVVSGVQGTAAG